MLADFDRGPMVLAVLMAIAAAFTALNLVQRVNASHGAAARGWLALGAVAVGAGVWAAQYLAMNSLRLPFVVEHHEPTLLFSLALSVVVCFFALWIASGPRIQGLRLAVAGLCMGLGLAGVHYTGIFAMQVVPAIFYDTKPFLWSLGIAVASAWFLLWMAFVLRRGLTLLTLLARAGAALVAGTGIAVFCYAGLIAANFAADSYSLGAASDPLADGRETPLVVMVTAAAMTLLGVMLLTIIDHARRQRELQPADPAAIVPLAVVERSFNAMHEAAHRAARLVAVMVVMTEGGGSTAGAPPVVPVLQELARRLAALVRPGDLVARFDTHRFVLLLAGLTEGAVAGRIAGRVLEEVGRPFTLAGEPDVQLTPHCGVALCPDDGEDLDTLLRVATRACTAAPAA